MTVLLNVVDVCVCVCVLRQLRQVSQAKRWDDVGTGRRSVRHSRLVESLDFPDEDFGVNLGIDTMAIKKRSSRTRRIRPVSTRMSLGDEPSPSPTPSAPSHSASLTHSASWESLSTLPTNGSPLRHVTHVRPRPPRRHRAAHIPPESHCSENGGVSMLEDGLPDFYSKRVLPDSQLSSLHQAQSLRRKKRRSVLSIFSGFRKNRNSTFSNQESECASENVYSMIQHPKDTGRPESAVPGANGTLSSPRPAQGVPAHGLRTASPPCSIQRQSTDLVSMVYSCIGAEIEDSDSSSTCDIKESLQHSADGSNAISDALTDPRSNGHVASSKHQTDRQMETARQERIVPLTESRTEAGEDVQSSGVGSARPEPPPHSSKPSLAVIRQRHLQDSSEEAGMPEGEEQSERLQEEKQRGRGPEGQRPLIPKKPNVDLQRDKTSPEMTRTSPKTPASLEEQNNDQKSSPPAQTAPDDNVSSETRSLGLEDADPTVISHDEEADHNGFPKTSHHTRKSNSFDIGYEGGNGDGAL
ncbi:PREDICTED: leucine-rich repeat-containing protein 16B-like isoform X2 [Poecilia mexicana]|uniref:leucine-rich repeat-containing protein 16B-like isoform X2 n=1 Tax=Poecilia mexicana TaxID=48701 RepID=UPI00072DA4AC|nr:PREDICTED: leucine-rich repeat-containing protein 16B-like isoform X2 [Poecilia mexicana]